MTETEINMESNEYFLHNNKHYDCVTRAHRIACRLLIVFILSYFLAVGIFWDWGNGDKYGTELGNW